MKASLSLALLAAVLGLASAGLFHHHSDDNSDKDLCTLDGEYKDLCSIPREGGIVTDGGGWTTVKCNCFGSGSEEAATDIANKVGEVLRDDREGFVQKVKGFLGFRNHNEDLSRLTWEVTGDDQQKQSFTRITKWVF